MARRAVIIGTGAGGLAAAAALAKQGWDVLGLEQSAHLGGYLNPFRRGEFQFDPGVHYVGEAGPDGALQVLLAELGIDATRAFHELDPDGFDVYRFPGAEMRVCRGLDRYRERLGQMFPHERAGLARFFAVAEGLGEAMRALTPIDGEPWIDRVRHLAKLPSLLRWQGASFGELLAAKIGDPHLRSILAAAGGCYGLPPSRASALAGVGTIVHYGNGAFFPRGGSGALRDKLVQAAERHGARFRTEAPVASISMWEGRTFGVELEGGEHLAADVVVSDTDPTITFGQLLDRAWVPPRLLEKARRTEPSVATFAVYLGMRRDLRRHGLGAFDVWDYPDWDIDAVYARAAEGNLAHAPMLFLSPNSLKDDAGALAPIGSSTLEIVTPFPYVMFARFRDRPHGDRGPEYEREKERVADWLLEAVEHRYPGLVGDVVVREASTPLTNELYTRAVQGAAYGSALTPAQVGHRRFGTTTHIPNLFLAGSGVLGDGVMSCLASGQLAARAVERRAAKERVPRSAPSVGGPGRAARV